MASTLERFWGRPTAEVHTRYGRSFLAPVAPEYTTGEGLVAAAYRKLLVGIPDSAVDLEQINHLADAVGTIAAELQPDAGGAARDQFVESWRELISVSGGLFSPPPAASKLPQLMPLVPATARYAGVIGKFGRNRWQPGNLLLSVMWSGLGPDQARLLLDDLVRALQVGDTDDVLGRYVEESLRPLMGDYPSVDLDVLESEGAAAAAWRTSRADGNIPAEIFAKDLATICRVKDALTRRQWTVLLEAQLRLGLGMHELWLCRLNSRVWDLLRLALRGSASSPAEVSAACWPSQESDEPILELGSDSAPAISRVLSDYAEARLAINLVLHLIDEVSPGAAPSLTSSSTIPADAVAALTETVADRADDLEQACQSLCGLSVTGAAGSLADRYPRFLSAQAGPTRNISFFIRYTLGQLQPADEDLSPYDQAYLIYRRGPRIRPVHPGPAMLISLVHCCCQSAGGIPASLESFRRHLAAYGVGTRSEEFRSGPTVRELERLGLVVDSPDAGGGRLLVDPLAKGHA